MFLDFFFKIKQSPKPIAVVELCAYRLLSTAYLMNEDVREEELFSEIPRAGMVNKT